MRLSSKRAGGGTELSAKVRGATLVRALAILSVKLSSRRMPAITTTFSGVGMGFPYDGHGRLAAHPSHVRQRCKCMYCWNFGSRHRQPPELCSSSYLTNSQKIPATAT